MKIKKEYLEVPFDCLKDLVIEPCLKFNSEGLSIKAFAESNAALCIFHLPKEKFIEYEFVDEQTFKISADLFFKVMKRLKTENIILNFKDQKLIVADEKGKEYSIAVMHDDEVEKDKPTLNLTSSFKMKTSELQDLFLDASIVSEEIKIETQGKLICSSGELNKFKEEIKCETVGEATTSYGLEYLNKFMSASKYFKEVLFEFDNNMPCKLTFKGDIELQFILAARCD